jgi:hypothetical protein
LPQRGRQERERIYAINAGNSKRGQTCAPDALIIYLPQALDLHKHVAEKNSPMESQGPEDQLVFVNPLERVPRVLEHHVIPINVVCT